jgi:hypothetical protein
MYLLAVVALAGTGCSENSSPTEPEAVQAVVTGGQAAGKPSRSPYISDLQLHSIYVDMGPDGTYDNAWDIVLTNPGSKASGLFLQSEIRQNQYTVDAGGTVIFCPALDGALAHGTCRMQWTITPRDWGCSGPNPDSHRSLGDGDAHRRLPARHGAHCGRRLP